MPTFKNARRSALDLASGRMLAPGELAEDGVDAENPHDAALIEDGSLIVCDPAAAQQDGVLRGQALKDRADELEIEGRSGMSADELRAAVAEAEADTNEEDE